MNFTDTKTKMTTKTSVNIYYVLTYLLFTVHGVKNGNFICLKKYRYIQKIYMDPKTVESVYNTRVSTLLDVDEDEAVQYMLKAIPLIKEYTQDTDVTNKGKESHLDSFGFSVTSTSSKNDVYCRYMAEVEGDQSLLFEQQPKIKKTSTAVTAWLCTTCKVPKVFVQAESSLVCQKCGVSENYIEMNMNNVSFDDQISMDVRNHCFYKRSNHFSEWVNSLQARESTVIPEDILEAIRVECKKNRVTDTKDITPDIVKKFLKKLRLSKWYEHTHAICHALGKPPPVLSPSLEARLKQMFQEIQAPFDKWKNIMVPQRKNFLSYSYVLYKFCELLGEDHLLQHFSLLKSTEKLQQMDMIWKKICEELQWQYIPSA